MLRTSPPNVRFLRQSLVCHRAPSAQVDKWTAFSGTSTGSMATACFGHPGHQKGQGFRQLTISEILVTQGLWGPIGQLDMVFPITPIIGIYVQLSITNQHKSESVIAALHHHFPIAMSCSNHINHRSFEVITITNRHKSESVIAALHHHFPIAVRGFNQGNHRSISSNHNHKPA